MNSTLKVAASFIFGAALGGAVVWYATNKFYKDHMQEEIDSVKAAYAKKYETSNEQDENETTDEKPEEKTEEEKPKDFKPIKARVRDPKAVFDYTTIYKTEDGETKHYHALIHPSELEPCSPSEDDDEEEEYMDDSLLPYPITDTEFGDDDRDTLTLVYYTDNILADAQDDEIIYNEEEVVGSTWKSAFKMGEDVAYIRNNGRSCDYEILRSDMSYTEDILPNKPPTLEEGYDLS